LLNKKFEIHAYINDEVMTYIINLTFVSRKTFEFFLIFPFIEALENEEFLNFDTE